MMNPPGLSHFRYFPNPVQASNTCTYDGESTVYYSCMGSYEVIGCIIYILISQLPSESVTGGFNSKIILLV